MKFVDQTRFGVPGGNCFSACLASILELPTNSVPYFMSDHLDSEEWKGNCATWLKQYGLYPLFLSANAKIPGPHIIHGNSPRATGKHAVVGVGDTIVHDPHPSRSGVTNVIEKTVIVPFQPRLAIF